MNVITDLVVGDIGWDINVHDTELLINCPVNVVRYTIDLFLSVLASRITTNVYSPPRHYEGRQICL
jgi:hypothetical protein